MVLAATNRPDLIDPAVLRSGRFDLLFELPMPDDATRERIFAIHTKNKPLGKDVDLKRLAKLMVGASGSDIEGVCRRAAMLAIREHIKHKSAVEVSSCHFEQALTMHQPAGCAVHS
jgi:transitional endoplasmic reticulum ATPase